MYFTNLRRGNLSTLMLVFSLYHVTNSSIIITRQHHHFVSSFIILSVLARVGQFHKTSLLGQSAWYDEACFKAGCHPWRQPYLLMMLVYTVRFTNNNINLTSIILSHWLSTRHSQGHPWKRCCVRRTVNVFCYCRKRSHIQEESVILTACTGSQNL